MEEKAQLLLNRLANGESGVETVGELRELMGFDDLNIAYFNTLYLKYKSGSDDASDSDKRILEIFDPKKEATKNALVAHPTAIASSELMGHLPYANYEDLCKEVSIDSAKKATLWIKKMQAGTGSSMTRDSYLADHYKKDISEISIGAKGTDLFVETKGKKISLAEAQVLQAIYDAKNQAYGNIVLHDIVGDETKSSIEKMWNGECLLDHQKTNREFVNSSLDITHFGESFQSQIPTLREDGKISFNRTAPGGHALFGVDGLMASYKEELQPREDGRVLIGSIGNGEDLSSSPDPVMVSWMVEKKIPLAMVTTTKTDIDLKGGQIAILPDGDKTYITMIEKAQAETANQIEYFEQLGLRDGDNKAFFNTNMVLLNYDVLTPMIKKLVDEVGEEEFLKIIAPDLILNNKAQIDSDGVERSYTQLEGAMGSVVLNLDRYWRDKYGMPIVHFLNVDSKDRTKFFSPIKTAFDFFMQMSSDRFLFNEESFRLENNRCGELPTVTLKDSFYKDVGNVLKTFQGCKICELDDLVVHGQVDFSGVVLSGKVVVKSQCKEMIKFIEKFEKAKTRLPRDLNRDGEPILRNISVSISQDGSIEDVTFFK